MQKQTKIFLVLALIVLLGTTASFMLILFGGPMFMGSGMMHMSGMSISNEYEFLVQMIPHHAEAVQAANTLRNNTERQEMRQFAEGIIQTQSAEIEMMKSWLIEWYPDKDHETQYDPMMRNLEGLQSDAVDVAFIEDMIPHHMAAVMMSQQLLVGGLADHNEVTALAKRIRDNQRAEIHLMTRWIAEWDGLGSTVTWFGIIVMMLLILLSAWVIVGSLSKSEYRPLTKISTKESLDIRYAKGEISREEYHKAREDVQDR